MLFCVCVLFFSFSVVIDYCGVVFPVCLPIRIGVLCLVIDSCVFMVCL